MTRGRIPMRSGPRDPERFPEEDEALGRSLFGLVAGGLARGLPRPVLLGLTADRVQQLDGPRLSQLPRRDRSLMLAAFAGQEGMACMALVGVLQVRMEGMREPGRAVSTFIEWPDNRWWAAWQFVDPARSLLGDGPVVRRAEDGWPRPGGVGGWFATARRTGVRLMLETSTAEGQETVH